MTTWSLQTESTNWDDDIKNGEFEELLEYCKEREITLDGKTARLAKIELDDEGSVVETLEYYTED